MVGIVRRRTILCDVPGRRVCLPRLDARDPFFVAVAITRWRQRLRRRQSVDTLRYTFDLLGLNRPENCLLCRIADEAGPLNNLRDGLRVLAVDKVIEHLLTSSAIVLGLRLGV